MWYMMNSAVIALNECTGMKQEDRVPVMTDTVRKDTGLSLFETAPEPGIGTNPKAKLCGILREDEKAANTIHIAPGNNTTFGGNVNVRMHYDGMIMNPTIYLGRERLGMETCLSTPVTASIVYNLNSLMS